MTDIQITMNTSGEFTINGDVGRIEEYCAKRLKISLNSVFTASSVRYYTLSFEPFSLSRKIITENIYRDSSVTTGIYYSDGYIFCPIYDYIAVSPRVLVQVDAYELDTDGNVTAIIKSGIFTLEFAPSLTGEGMMLETVRPDVKFNQNVKNALTEAMETMPIDGKNIIDCTIEGRKIAPLTITYAELADECLIEELFTDGCVPARALPDGIITSQKIANGAITSEDLAENSVTTNKIASKNITSDCIADKAVTYSKLALNSVAEDNIRSGAVATKHLAYGSVTPDKLDRRYLTEHQSLSGYATENWIKAQGYLTDVSMKADKTDLPKKLSELENDVAVSFLTQKLSEDEKITARKNIGAVAVEDGKGLSSNDFTDSDKSKLDSALTEHQSLDGYATENWVKEQGYVDDISSKADKSELSEVAFSGSYNDLKDLPVIKCNFNDELKISYDEAYTHSKTAHAPADAEKNIVNGAFLNGEEVEIKDKKLDLNVMCHVVKQLVFAEV